MNEAAAPAGDDPATWFFGPMRPRFLLLALVCVLLGWAAAAWMGARPGALPVLLAFVGGLAAHAAVNALNEWHDFRSGLDLLTRRTPFSGGTGTLPRWPQHVRGTLVIGLAGVAVTVLVGVYFLRTRGWGIVPLGLLGVLTIVAYTPRITRSPLLCLIAPGLGFGPLMVMGTAWALGAPYGWPSFVASLLPFFLVSDLLLLNQFPDVEPDRAVGRRHLLTTIGPRRSAVIYGAFLAAAYLAVVAGWLAGALPAQALLALLAAPLAVRAALGAYRHAEDVPRLIPHMIANVLLNLVSPALLAVGLFWAA